jgi:spermidine/putrescine transport system substrate-binding protein
MWDSDYSGNILQFNNPRDAFGTAMYYLGYDVNEATDAEWDAALDKLKEQKSIVQGYVMDEIFNKMKSGSAAVAAYYAGDFLSMYEANDSLAFYYPKEGTNIFVDAMCVPTTSENKIIAERYIDFMLSEDIATANAEYTYYASPNTLVTSSQEYKDYITSVNPDAMEILYSSAEAVPTSFFKNLSDEKLQRVNSLWEELKIESSSIGSAVYIGCGMIVLIIAGFITFKVIQKKKRNNYD